ncbi:MAG: hypothetical protein ACW99J_20955 [Candidatus Thorarchaeota archaeon]
MTEDMDMPEIHIHDGSVHSDCDWPECRKLVMNTIRSNQHDIKEVRVDIRDIKNWMVERNGQPPATEIAKAVQETLNGRTKDSGELTTEEIEKIARRAAANANGKSNSTWEPWKYVLLGGALGFGSNVFLKIVEIVAS